MIPQVYTNGEFGKVRAVVIEGSPWFVAKDVCEVLEISKYRDAIARLDPEDRCPVVLDTGRGARRYTGISEAGLYELVFTSRKAEARAFKRWVTAEVLPEIRRSGVYDVQRSSREMEILFNRWNREVNEVWIPRLLALGSGSK